MATTRTQGGATAKDARLDIRMTPDQKRLIERAAAVNCLSITGFVMSCVEKATRRALRDYEEMTLTKRESEAFVQALLIEPPMPSRRLSEAARRYREDLSR